MRTFLKRKGKIAIIGASTNPAKAGNFVPRYMISLGFEIIPINPMVEELFGIKTLKSLDDLTEKIVGVIIYRKQEIAETIAIQAIDKGIPLIWLPLGIKSEKVAHYSREKNIIYVEDKCPKNEGPRLL